MTRFQHLHRFAFREMVAKIDARIRAAGLGPMALTMKDLRQIWSTAHIVARSREDE
jgi:hypothetical protein